MRRVIYSLVLLGFLLAFGALIRACTSPVTHGLQRETFSDNAVSPATVLKQVTHKTLAPNIVVILADDLGYGDVGAYGGKAIKTPNIDALAMAGMRFSSAYASASLCSPSRAGLLTGRYPLRSGISQPLQAADDSLLRKLSFQAGLAISNLGSMDMLGGENMVDGLPDSEITIAEQLQNAGYRTALFGKWHLGDFSKLEQFHPYHHGFDEFVGFNMSNDDWPVAFYRGEEQIIADIGLAQQKYTRLFTEEAVSFIEESGDKPFFLILSQKDPHQPFFPSTQFAGLSEGGPYGDAVSEFDWSVGEIVQTLEHLDIADNTLVIVTSDNGPWYEGSAGELRGRKGQSYEGGFRVPMVAWWPGKIQAQSVTRTPVMNIDLFPTFTKLAGIALPADRTIDGWDLSSVLFSEKSGLEERPLFFYHDYDVEGLRLGDWKYIASNSHYTWPNPLDKMDSFIGKATSSRNYRDSETGVSIPTLGTWPLLYHLGQDPGEAYNVAAKYPEVAQKMASILETWRAEFYANPRQLNPVPKQVEK